MKPTPVDLTRNRVIKQLHSNAPDVKDKKTQVASFVKKVSTTSTYAPLKTLASQPYLFEKHVMLSHPTSSCKKIPQELTKDSQVEVRQIYSRRKSAISTKQSLLHHKKEQINNSTKKLPQSSAKQRVNVLNINTKNAEIKQIHNALLYPFFISKIKHEIATLQFWPNKLGSCDNNHVPLSLVISLT